MAPPSVAPANATPKPSSSTSGSTKGSIPPCISRWICFSNSNVLLSVQQNSGLNSPTDGDAMTKLKGLKCRECGRHYAAAPVHVCEFCFGPREVDYRYDAPKGVVRRASNDR